MSQILSILSSIVVLLEDIRSRSADPEGSMTAGEAARFLGVHKQELLRYAQAGLPHYEMGKGFKFRRADLIEWRERFRVEHSKNRRRAA